MELKEMYVGQLIYLKNLKYTTPEFTSNEKMRNMVAKWWKVSKITSRGFKIIYISEGRVRNEFIFDARDAIKEFTQPIGDGTIVLYKKGDETFFDKEQLLI